jgi:hypothetical protein
MVLDTSSINFFMPIFSFLFVFVIVYAVLAKTKLLGGNKFVDLTTGFIMSIIFMSFSSAQRYVETIVPWAAVMMVVVFLILLIAGLSTDDLKKIMTTKFAWAVISILILIFLITAVRVFNPIFHQDYLLTTGTGSTTIVSQLLSYMNSGVTGGILLLIMGLIVAWIITKR